MYYFGQKPSGSRIKFIYVFNLYCSIINKFVNLSIIDHKTETALFLQFLKNRTSRYLFLGY